MFLFFTGISPICLAFDQAGARNTKSIRPEYFGSGYSLCSGEGLVKQGFSGSMTRETDIAFIGRVVSHNVKYLIYHYSFANPETLHGWQRMIVLKSNCDYVGSYPLDGGIQKTSGEAVYFSVPRAHGNVARFRNGRVPDRIWIDRNVRYLVK